jgi:hypothetical protein
MVIASGRIQFPPSLRLASVLIAAFAALFAASILSAPGAEASSWHYRKGYAVGEKAGRTDGYKDGYKDAYRASFRDRLEETMSYSDGARDYAEGYKDGYRAGYEKGWRLGKRDGSWGGRRDADEWRHGLRNEMRRRCREGYCD